MCTNHVPFRRYIQRPSNLRLSRTELLFLWFWCHCRSGMKTYQHTEMKLRRWEAEHRRSWRRAMRAAGWAARPPSWPPATRPCCSKCWWAAPDIYKRPLASWAYTVFTGSYWTCLMIHSGPGPGASDRGSVFSLISQEQIKFLEEEIQSLEETESSLSCYADWYGSTHKNFKNVATKIDKVDEVMMGKKLKTLEVGRHPPVSNLPSSPHDPLPLGRSRSMRLFLTPSCL